MLCPDRNTQPSQAIQGCPAGDVDAHASQGIGGQQVGSQLLPADVAHGHLVTGRTTAWTTTAMQRLPSVAVGIDLTVSDTLRSFGYMSATTSTGWYPGHG